MEMEESPSPGGKPEAPPPPMPDSNPLPAEPEPSVKLPDEEAPREVEVDAMEELDRIHNAANFSEDSFDLGDFGAYGMQDSPRPAAPIPSYEPIGSPQVRREEPPPRRRDLHSLEDLYDAHPELGDGSTYLRIERKHPARYGGRPIAGFIEDVHEQITMRAFVQKYGGGTYEVYVRGPGRGTTMDADGQYRERTLNNITVKVPGTPVMSGTGDDDMATNSWDRSGGMSDRVMLKRMDHEADQIRRMEQRNEQLRRELSEKNRQDPEFINTLTQLAERRAHDTKESSNIIISDQRQEISRLRDSLQDLQQKLNDERNSKVQLQTDFAQKLREEETRQVRELKMQHEQAVSQLRANQSEQIERMQREHERRISELTERHQRDLSDLRNTEARERERLRDDANRREKGLQDDFNRRDQAFRDRENSLKEDFARREESMRREYEMRIQQLERANKQHVDLIRSTESNNSSLAQQTANMQIGLMQQQVARLEQDLAAAHAENAEVRRELDRHTNKSLMQQVEETKTIGETLGLFKKDEEEFNWQKGLFNTIKDVVNKAPDIARGLGEARQQNQMAVAQAQHRAALAQQRAASASRGLPAPTAAPGMVNAAPPRPQPQRNVSPHPADARPFSPTPAPGMGSGGWDSGPSDPFGDGNLPPAPQGPPVVSAQAEEETFAASASVDTQPWSPSDPFAQPTQPQEGQSIEQASNPQVDEPQAAQPQQPQLVEAPAAPEPPPIDFTPAQLEEFAGRLNEAIDNGIIEPPTFAAGFIDQVGPEKTLQLMNALSAEDFVAAITSTGAEIAITTRRGQKYVDELWTHAKEQAEARLRAGAVGPQA